MNELRTRSGRKPSQNAWELAQLIGLLKESDARSFLEIGSRHGDTFYEVMLSLPVGSKGVAVDLGGGAWGTPKSVRYLDDCAADLRARGYDIAVIFGDSASQGVIDAVKAHGHFDGALIDGDHRYDAVKQDFENYGNLAKVLAFHDIAGDGQHTKDAHKLPVEVPKLWRELVGEPDSQKDYIEFIAPESAMGIGVIAPRGIQSFAPAPVLRPRKKAVIVANAEHQEGWGGAYAEGLRRHGWDVEVRRNPKECDLLVLWGVRNTQAIARQKANGGEVCVLERGYLGDRFAWSSVSYGGGLNGRGVFYVPENASLERFNTYFLDLMQDWQRRDGYALILGQVPGDMSLKGLQPPVLWDGAANALQAAGYDVRFRPHPLSTNVRVNGTMLSDPKQPMNEALSGASLAVAINSNASVEAVLAGVPTLTLDEGAMAWPVTGHAVGEVITPDRERWAAELAWKQWTMEELASGQHHEVVNAVGSVF